MSIPRVMMLANLEISSSLKLRSGMIILDRGIDAPANRLTKLTTRDPPICLVDEENIVT